MRRKARPWASASTLDGQPLADRRRPPVHAARFPISGREMRRPLPCPVTTCASPLPWGPKEHASLGVTSAGNMPRARIHCDGRPRCGSPAGSTEKLGAFMCPHFRVLKCSFGSSVLWGRAGGEAELGVGDHPMARRPVTQWEGKRWPRGSSWGLLTSSINSPQGRGRGEVARVRCSSPSGWERKGRARWGYHQGFRGPLRKLWPLRKVQGEEDLACRS